MGLRSKWAFDEARGPASVAAPWSCWVVISARPRCKGAGLPCQSIAASMGARPLDSGWRAASPGASRKRNGLSPPR